MKHMTYEMKHIARQTKTDTVSVKIITVVTLFFLPETFISVCLFVFFSLVSYEFILHTKQDTVRFRSNVSFPLQHNPGNEGSYSNLIKYGFR